MNAPQSFEAWWLEYSATASHLKPLLHTKPEETSARAAWMSGQMSARAAWMAGQTAALALSGSRVVYVLDYIGSDDIPRRMIYATRAAADRAFQRSNKRAMVTVETVRTF